MLYVSAPTNHFRFNEQGNKVPADGISNDAFEGLDALAIVINKVNDLRCLDNKTKARASAELMQEYFRLLGHALS